MRIVIPAAGKSQRFKEAGFFLPKLFLPVGEKLMIEHVIEMFDQQDEFLLIISEESRTEFNQEYEKLCSKYRNLKIAAIPSHALGPGFSIANDKVFDFVLDSSFIVTYCDFFVEWNYKKFLEFISSTSPAGSIVSFKGLQPSSLGSTMFAYLRVFGNQVLQVREKASFTENRMSEFASTGIYYFANWKTYVNAFKNLNNELPNTSERYVSLLFNYIRSAKLEVNHFEANKFVCLGTPEDYNEYLSWYNFFNNRNLSLEPQEIIVDLSILPMAGQGQRFSDAGYRLPKPFIPINSVPMFIATLDSLPQCKEYAIITKPNFALRVQSTLNQIRPNQQVNVEVLAESTFGPGETLLSFPKLFEEGKSLIVSSCDYEHQFSTSKFRDAIADKLIDGLVFTTKFSKFRMRNPNAFAYCVEGLNREIFKIVEKKTISDQPEEDALVVGTFWFRDAADLRSALEDAVANNYRVNGEIYVGTSINLLIEKGLNFRCFEVDNWISYGDPFELDLYHWWEELLGDEKT